MSWERGLSLDVDEQMSPAGFVPQPKIAPGRLGGFLKWRGAVSGTRFPRSAAAAKSQHNPIDGNPPGSPVPGILQARTLEWVAISFSNVPKIRFK